MVYVYLHIKMGKNLNTYQLGPRYQGCQYINLLVYTQDPDMHTGRHLSSECLQTSSFR